MTPAASAETYTHKDPRGDVVKKVWEEGEFPTRAANGDIVRIRVTYTDKQLVTVIKFRKLTKKAKWMWIGASLHYRRGSEHVYGEAEMVLRHKGPRQPRAKYAELNEPGCRMESHISYRHDSVRYAVPAACIDNTRWVDISVAAYRGDNYETPSYFIVDQAPDNEPAFGARVRRG
jgi:hypothetical protein